MYGYVSDVDDDDTTMDTADVTVVVRLDKLPAQEALAIVQQSGEDDLSAEQRGKLMEGEQLEDYVEARFHLPFGHGLTALASVDAIDLPEQPPQEPEEVVEES